MSDLPRPPTVPPEPSHAEPAPAAPRTASLLQVAGAVLWSFLGIRKGRHMQQDTTTIKLHHVVLVGVALAAVFVLSLIALVTYITRHAH
jgi:hypothetical protein